MWDSGVVNTKTTDPRVSDDIAILGRMRKKCILDFIKWTDDPRSVAVHLPKLKRRIACATLHDVSGPVLARLPEAVLDRPVAALEFSIDFVAKKARSDEEQLAELFLVYDLLHRRVAPWKGRHMTLGMRRSDAEGVNDTMRTAAPRSGPTASGNVWMKNPKHMYMLPLRRSGVSLLRSHSVYFGHRYVVPSWATYTREPRPMVEVRLYLKVTDDVGQAIPRSKWRTRIEVTANGPVLRDVMGVISVRDLQGADWRSLVREYLRLHSAQPRPPNRLKRASPSRPLAALLSTATRRAHQDAQAAMTHGNFTAEEDGMVEFAAAADLDRPIFAAVDSFRRAIQRAKS